MSDQIVESILAELQPASEFVIPLAKYAEAVYDRSYTGFCGHAF
ncbi:hypothetical protein CASFOL_037039 [Castilleja foliolosa]